MSNLFDGLQDTAFAIVTNTMGYTATWVPSSGLIPGGLTAQVLFKDATEMARLLQIEYDPQRAMIEYTINDLPGLKASVDLKTDELVVINGIQYGVEKVRALADGKTLAADLQLI